MVVVRELIEQEVRVAQESPERRAVQVRVLQERLLSPPTASQAAIQRIGRTLLPPAKRL